MRKIERPDGESVNSFYEEVATVLATTIWSESDVSGHGGGGGGVVVAGYGAGRTRGVEISTDVRIRRETWLRISDGREQRIVTGQAVALREGQRLRLLYVRESGGAPELVRMANEATGASYVVSNRFESGPERPVVVALAALAVLQFPVTCTASLWTGWTESGVGPAFAVLLGGIALAMIARLAGKPDRSRERTAEIASVWADAPGEMIVVES